MHFLPSAVENSPAEFRILPGMSEQGDRKGASTKVCVQCKRDCSARPRQKDAQGRYHCQECVDKRTAEKQAAAAVAVEEPVEPFMLDIPISAPVAKMPSGRPCPDCGAFLPEKTVICVGCGFNAQTGMKAQAEKPIKAKKSLRGPGKCTGCGYSLKGLKSPKCPECGTVNVPQTDKRLQDREDSKAVVRKAYLQPLIMFVVGACVSCALFGAYGASSNDIADYLIGFGIKVPIGLVVYVICGMLWLGFDAPLHLIAIRLLGIYAVVEAIQVGADIILPTMVAGLIGCAFYVHLLSEMVDMDLPDAVIVGLLTFLAKFLITMYIITQYMS